VKHYKPTRIIKFALSAYLIDITVHALLGNSLSLFWLPTLAVIAVLFLREREFLLYLILLTLPILGTLVKFLFSSSSLGNNELLIIAESTLLLAVTTAVLTPYKLLISRYRKYLSQIIEIDPLTKTLNRRALMARLKLYLSAGIPISVMMLDIDNFKRINDTYGHLTGDKVLKELSEIIEKSLRSEDFVGRYGGEEFLIVLPRTNKETAFKVAERIRRKIERHRFPVPEPVTVSIGVADSTEGESLEELISLADERLYRAKRSGKNRVIAA
jgi:diguanylate cyclase (GGDEF)-like protein